MDTGRARFWRLVGFSTMYGLAALGITLVFWRSPQPSADVLTTTTTSSTTPTTSSTSTTTTTTSNASLDKALQQVIALSANSAYGISGTASFSNPSTVLLHQFSIIARGPKIQIQLQDANGQALAVLKDISQQTLDKEDLVLTVPTTVDLAQVASLAIIAPDYSLVLSSATWRSSASSTTTTGNTTQ